MKNAVEYDKVLYKSNLNRKFYLYCLKKDIKLIRFVFYNIINIIISFLFNSKKDIYERKKFKYLKYVKNIDDKKKDFYKKIKLNDYYEFNENIIIARIPREILNIDNKIELIAYELDNNYTVKIDEFIEKIEKLKVNKIYVNKISLLKSINSSKKYYVRNNLILKLNKKDIPYWLRISFTICLLAFILTCISFCYAVAVLDMTFIKTYFEIRLFLMNFLPLTFLITLLYFMTKRIHISYLITTILVMGLGIANQTKLLYRDDIVKFEDLLLLKEAAIMTTRYELVIKWYTIIFIIILGVLFFILKRYVKKLELKWWKQLIGIILILSVGIITYNKLYKNDELYNSLGDQSIINVWISTRQYQIRGLIYPFIYTAKDIIQEEPKNYNEEEIKEILNEYTYQDIPDDKKVNIIAIMLEAYNDFTKFDVIDFNEDIYEKFHLIEDKSLSGNLVTSIFAGGTIVTERNFLTGYYNFPSFRKETNSYVWYFKEQGYITEANHPIYGAFYNRASVNINLGFDNYYNYENRYSLVQYNFVNDEMFFQDIINSYEEAKKENKPYFNFSVTYQNHGPYSSETYDGKKYYFDKNDMSDEAYNTVNNYFEGIENTNNALYELINYFEKEKEPTIIILFGDHNPFLGDTGYEELGINLDLSEEEGFLNYYETPYIIYGNSKAKELFNKSFIGKGNDISPMFLMNELFDYVELDGNEYLQYMSDLKKEIDVINPYYNKIDSKYIKSEENKLVQEYELVNYYVSKNFHYNK